MVLFNEACQTHDSTFPPARKGPPDRFAVNIQAAIDLPFAFYHQSFALKIVLN